MVIEARSNRTHSLQESLPYLHRANSLVGKRDMNTNGCNKLLQ